MEKRGGQSLRGTSALRTLVEDYQNYHLKRRGRNVTFQFKHSNCFPLYLQWNSWSIMGPQFPPLLPFSFLLILHQTHCLSCISLNTPSIFLSLGICSCFFSYLECFYPQYSPGSLPHIVQISIKLLLRALSDCLVSSDNFSIVTFFFYVACCLVLIR